MAEPALHTLEDAHHSKTTVFPQSFVSPLANSSDYQAILEASNGDPSSNSAQGDTGFGAPYPPSCHFFHNKTLSPHGGCLFKNPSTFFEDPSVQSRADFSCFVLPHAVSACPNAKLRADSAGFPYPEALSKGPHTHFTTVDAYTEQIIEEPSSAVCVLSCEESVRLHEEQVDSTKPCGHYEDFTCTHIKSNDPNHPSRVVCAGFAYAGTKIQDPLVQSSTASAHSDEKSTSLHEECGDSTEPCRSSEDFTFSHAVYEDLCADNVGFACIKESRGDATNTHDCGEDPFEDLVDPCFQELDAHVTNILQPSSSECSSAISMVTNAASESTSRLDDAFTSVDCIESEWTDAKHGSYLNYMETNFVKNLYGSEYCAVDVCGQGPFHPLSSTLFEFKSWQSGDWRRRSMLKPPFPTCIPLTFLKSPWENHFRHHNSPHAKHQIKIKNASTSCGIDEGEEVNSPSPEVRREALSHPHTLRCKMGLEEKFLCKNGSSGNDEAAGILKQDGSQEFAPDTENASFSNMKKRGFETYFEQEPSIRCKRGRCLSDKM